MSIELIRYNEACRAIVECSSLSELKDRIDRASAIKDYARRAQDRELEVNAGVIRFRAERRFGELLAEMKDSGQLSDGRPIKTLLTKVGFSPRVILSELGVSYNFSARCQKLAQQPTQKFEAAIADWRRRAMANDKDELAMKERERAERRRLREEALGKMQLALPKKKYGVIVADPEWRFEPWSRETGMAKAADNHYCTSQLEVIKSRNVQSIAADDCVLFLWATQPMLPEAMTVLTAWGFEYKSHFIWAKDRIGPGYWSRNKHEVLLLGTRGEPPCPAPGAQWDSLLEAPRKGHSEKPEIFLEMVECYFPTMPKVELNRRGPKRHGWDAWGAETEGTASNTGLRSIG